MKAWNYRAKEKVLHRRMDNFAITIGVMAMIYFCGHLMWFGL